MMKTQFRLCKKCGENKVLSAFAKYDNSYQGGSAGYRSECQQCLNRRVQHSIRKGLYGINREQYQELLVKQDGRCAACGSGGTAMANGRVKELAVDHCHVTGKIRGLLCHDCNSALGAVKDDANRLRRLASYVEVADTGYTVTGFVEERMERLRKPRALVDADNMLDEINNLTVKEP
jgi:hypothetical protein